MSTNTIYTNKNSVEYRYENFLIKSKEIHNDLYDLSKVIYKNNTTKVIFGCAIHGDFIQAPKSHLRGNGCPKCGGVWVYNTKSFNDKVSIIHNNFYDLSKVIYKNSTTKVTIGCPDHGDYDQTPSSHMAGRGCYRCSKNSTYDTEEFINRSNIIHNNLYRYPNTIFTKSNEQLLVECNIHGEFAQIAGNHLQGANCPKCANLTRSVKSGFGYNVRKDDPDADDICYHYIIELSNSTEKFYKTGISNNPKERFRKINKIGYSVNIKNIMVDTRYHCFLLEQKILKSRRRCNTIYTPEIQFQGWTECYTK